MSKVTVIEVDDNGQNKTIKDYPEMRDVSDGYHTFDELYEHRMALTLALMTMLPRFSWKSKQHHPDGDPMFDGFFIVGIDLPTGVITYHYKLEHWDKFVDVRDIDYAPAWDGHTPADVVKRLNHAIPPLPTLTTSAAGLVDRPSVVAVAALAAVA